MNQVGGRYPLFGSVEIGSVEQNGLFAPFFDELLKMGESLFRHRHRCNHEDECHDDQN